MKSRNLSVLLSSLLVAFFASAMSAQVITPGPVSPGPSCYQVMVDRPWFGEWENVSIYSSPLQTGCLNELVPVERWIQGWQKIAQFTATSTNPDRREKIGELSNLESGNYRAGGRYFTVGSFSRVWETNLVVPGRMIREGNLYFRASISAVLVFNVGARLYQVGRNGEFESRLVIITEVSPLMVAWGFATADELQACPVTYADFQCVKVKLPAESSFDLMRPLFLGFTDGVGIPADGMVFYPQGSSLRSDTNAEGAETGRDDGSHRVPPPPR